MPPRTRGEDDVSVNGQEQQLGLHGLWGRDRNGVPEPKAGTGRIRARQAQAGGESDKVKSEPSSGSFSLVLQARPPC